MDEGAETAVGARERSVGGGGSCGGFQSAWLLELLPAEVEVVGCCWTLRGSCWSLTRMGRGGVGGGLARGVGSSGCSAGVLGSDDRRPLQRIMGVGCTAGAGPERELVAKVEEGEGAGLADAAAEVVSGDELLLLTVIVTGERGVGSAAWGSCMEG